MNTATLEDVNSGKLAYLLDGGENQHRNLWSMDIPDSAGKSDSEFASQAHPVYGTGKPSYYKVVVSGAANGSVSIDNKQEVYAA